MQAFCQESLLHAQPSCRFSFFSSSHIVYLHPLLSDLSSHYLTFFHLPLYHVPLTPHLNREISFQYLEGTEIKKHPKLHYKAVPFTKFKEPDLEPSMGLNIHFWERRVLLEHSSRSLCPYPEIRVDTAETFRHCIHTAG